MSRVLPISVLAAVFACTPAFAAAIYSVQIDDAGTSLQNAILTTPNYPGGATFELQGELNDPLPGYVYVYDETGTNIVDLLIFNGDTTIDLLPAAAIPVKAAPKGTLASIVNQDPGTDQAEYWVSAGSGAPGDVGTISARYTIISDLSASSVPEPASYLLIGASLLLAALWRASGSANSPRSPGQRREITEKT